MKTPLPIPHARLSAAILVAGSLSSLAGAKDLA